MTGPRKSRRRLFTAAIRAEFLEHLRRSGNQRAAARALGFTRAAPEQRRRRDPAFDQACRAAEHEAACRLAGARDAFDHDGDARFETIKRGPAGRLQIVATRAGKWSKPTERLFLDILRDCGNIAAAARAVGFTASRIWQRRRQWPAFAERMAAALDEAEVALEFKLAALGNDIDAAATDGEGDEADAPPAQASAKLAFDPDLALRFLKWREDKRRGQQHRGRDAWRKPPPIEEVSESIVRKVAAIRRSRETRQLEEGWTRDEEGRMIPPGWVRAEAAGGGLGGGKNDGATSSAA